MAESMRLRFGRWPAAVALIGVLGFTSAGWAAPPLALDGRLTTVAGGPVADGKYKMTVRLFADETGGKALDEHVVGQVEVKAGLFSLSWTVEAGALTAGAAWMEVQAENDTLPRSPLATAPYAMLADTAKKAGLAAVAETLKCSGCVTTNLIGKAAVGGAHIAASAVGTVHLALGAVKGDKIGLATVTGAHLAFTYAGSKTKGGPATSALLADVAKLADSATVASDLKCTGCVAVSELALDTDLDLKGKALKAGAVVAGMFVGDGSKLTGLPTPKGNCPTGKFLQGVGANGELVCATPPETKYTGADFASSGQDCAVGSVVTGVGKDGKLTCLPLLGKDGKVTPGLLPFDKGALIAPEDRALVKGLAEYKTAHFSVLGLGINKLEAAKVRQGVAFGPGKKVVGSLVPPKGSATAKDVCAGKTYVHTDWSLNTGAAKADSALKAENVRKGVTVKDSCGVSVSGSLTPGAIKASSGGCQQDQKHDCPAGGGNCLLYYRARLTCPEKGARFVVYIAAKKTSSADVWSNHHLAHTSAVGEYSPWTIKSNYHPLCHFGAYCVY